MAKYLLDTNICIFYFKGRYNLDKRIKKIGFENCYISEITLAELLYGAECSDFVSKNMELIHCFSKEITVLPIYNALNVYAREKSRLRKIGQILDDFDLLIGSTAIANEMILVTENEKHLKRLSKIKIENWIKR